MPPAARPARRRPNILLVCTDQQRYDTLGAYGAAHARTPVLDRLASEGVLFEQCYVQNPVCSPSRASLMTSRYVGAHGLHANGVDLPPGNPLFMRALADAGYRCGLVGKQHLAACSGGRTEPRRDEGYTYRAWSHDPGHGSPENAYHHWLREKHPALWEKATAGGGVKGDGLTVPEGTVTLDAMPTEAHYSTWAAEAATAFLERHSLEEQQTADEPFFLWLNFYDPHHPFTAPQEFLDRIDPGSLPDPVVSDLSDRPAVLTEASRGSYGGALPGFADKSPEEIRELVRAYHAMVALVDDRTGRVLDALERLGLAEDTLVVFTSDHGEMAGDHQLLLKGPMFYEGAVRVPLLMRWPGVLPAGRRVDGPVQWIDLAPTFLDAAGAPPMPSAQGASLRPVATGEGPAPRDWALCEYRDSGHSYDPPVHATMLRRERWKLVVHHGGPASGRARDGELYDLEADPAERVNLWHDPGSARLRSQLQEFLLDTLVAVQDRTAPRSAPW